MLTLASFESKTFSSNFCPTNCFSKITPILVNFAISATFWIVFVRVTLKFVFLAIWSMKNKLYLLIYFLSTCNFWSMHAKGLSMHKLLEKDNLIGDLGNNLRMYLFVQSKLEMNSRLQAPSWFRLTLPRVLQYCLLNKQSLGYVLPSVPHTG